MMDSEIWHLLCIVTPCVFCRVWWLVTIEFVKVTVHKDITFTAAWSKCCIYMWWYPCKYIATFVSTITLNETCMASS